MPTLTLKKRIHLIAILVLIGTYLIRTPGVLDEYRIGRFAFLTLVCILGLIFVFPKAKAPIKLNILDFAFIGYYITAISSLFWAGLPSAGYLSAQTILLSLICFLFFRYFYSSKSDPFLDKVFLALSLIAIGAAGWDFLKVAFDTGLGAKHIYKVIGLSAHKNLLASFLFFLFGYQLLFLVKNKGSWWRYAIILLLFIFIVLLRCRAVYLALFLSACPLVIYFIKNQSKRGIKFIKIAVPILVLGLMTSIGLFLKAGGSQQDIKDLNPLQYLNSGSGQERLFVWYKTKKLIEDDWLAGVGIGNWKIQIPREGLAGSYRMQEHNVVFTRVHNDFLEVWAEQGIFGFLFFSLLFVLPLMASIFSIRQKKASIENYILIGILTGFALISFLDFPKERIEHQVMFAFTLAMIVHANVRFFDQNRFNKDLTSNQWNGIIYLLVALTFINFPLSYHQFKGESKSVEIMQYRLSNNWVEMERKAQETHSNWFQITPVCIPIKWYEGLAQYNQNKFPEAFNSFTQANKEHPYQFMSINDFASCSVQLKNFEKATELYQKALQINPLYEEAKFNLAYALAQMNRFQEARELVQQTQNNPSKKANFLNEIDRLETIQKNPSPNIDNE